MANTMTLNIATSILDADCKQTLNTMLANGWCMANTSYETTQQVLSPGEMSHLLRHGIVNGASGYIGALKTYAVPKFGPAAGVAISFQLNVDLAQ